MFSCDNERDERAAAWHAARPHADDGGSGGSSGRQLLFVFPLSSNLFVHKGKNRCGGLSGSSDVRDDEGIGVDGGEWCEAHEPKFTENLVPPNLRELRLPAVKNGCHIFPL